jgi:choline dehydrogenase-like flavoprotein
MHIDLEQKSQPQQFHSSVCVIGGGIAGITLATRLSSRGIHVHLLEAGGLEQEERSQALYHSHMAADNHRSTNDGRFRTFGGSSTQWGGQILPYTRDVFTPRPGHPNLAWPIDEADLTLYYDDVQSILGVDPLPFTSELPSRLGHPSPPTSSDICARFSKWTPFNRRNLAKTLGAQALADPLTSVFTHANTTSLHVDPNDASRIARVRVVNYSGVEFTFTADQFVVAAGTIESCRILLCSSEVPNPHDLIGRYLHDHVAYHAALFHSPARERITSFTGPFYVDGTLHSCKFEASDDLRRREGLLCVMAHVVVIEPEDSGIAAIRNMLRSLQHGKIGEALTANLLPMLRGTGDVLRLAYQSRFKKRRAVSDRAVLRLNIDVEQAPNRDNRITLSPTHRDALGLPVTIVDWRIGDLEKDTAARFAHCIRRYLADNGYEPGEWDASLRDGTMPQMLDTNHPMGGLRMGDDPRSSVVDSDLKHHHLANLHVASCAVFPSGSSSNPTFTMMALTLRLADHLAGILKLQATQPLEQVAMSPIPHR